MTTTSDALASRTPRPDQPRRAATLGHRPSTFDTHDFEIELEHRAVGRTASSHSFAKSPTVRRAAWRSRPEPISTLACARTRRASRSVAKPLTRFCRRLLSSPAEGRSGRTNSPSPATVFSRRHRQRWHKSPPAQPYGRWTGPDARRDYSSRRYYSSDWDRRDSVYGVDASAEMIAFGRRGVLDPVLMGSTGALGLPGVLTRSVAGTENRRRPRPATGASTRPSDRPGWPRPPGRH